MEIYINNKKLKSALEDKARCKKLYGDEMAQKVSLRMAALKAAITLVDFWPPMRGPERCHELKADLAGQFFMDLKHPYRLLFVATESPSKIDYPNEKDRWSAIKSIEILGIEDTHG